MKRGTMPPLAAIADHWAERPDLRMLFPELRCFGIGWGEPFCFRCGWLAPSGEAPDFRGPHRRRLKLAWNAASGWLERAHLRDHAYGGDEGVENLVPLCILCHEAQPACKSKAAGIAFVNHPPADAHLTPWVRVVTDELGRGKRRPGKQQALRIMLRARAITAQALLEEARGEAE